ncbi:phosphoribosylamine--glycine ligase [Pseudomonas syringae]|uniref:phosphoribosylamine--glycine ligase n=1 Tax=Pseudomonas syringae TaxID=317 RepID=UPI001EEF0BEF|nr:phosphoribosylamine--glycine ligase [Pseudomonas syringae]MCF9002366.1 phosphoribosylamine--glycine ligase [Pseudomonas syringae]
MKILIVGAGSGAHALAWKLVQSDQVEKVYVAPGSPGTASEPKVENLDVASTDIPGLAEVAVRYAIDFTLITPTQALEAGIVDYFNARDLKILAATRDASKLEWSKEYSKQFMHRHKIRTPHFEVFTDVVAAKRYAENRTLPLVLKVDGMAAGGIGVVIAHEWEEVCSTLDHLFTTYGGKIIVEDFLVGEEVSFTVLFDGTHYIPMAESRDYKKLHDGDKGPNTGGMGAYSPVLSKTLFQRIIDRLVEPVIKAIKEDSIDYLGFLYFGVMIDSNQDVHLLEINCRLGNPELFPMLERLDSELGPLLKQAVDKQLQYADVRWNDKYAVALQISSAGYPEMKRKGDIISLPLGEQKAKIFYAAVSSIEGELVSKGGRVISISACADTLEEARDHLYSVAKKVHFDGMHYRKDIAALIPN